MSKIILLWYLINGTVECDRDPNGTKIYTIKSIEVTEAYKPEVLNWIKTDVFEYDETLEDKVGCIKSLNFK